MHRRITDLRQGDAIIDGRLSECCIQAGMLAMFLACIVLAAIIFSPLLFFGADRWRR